MQTDKTLTLREAARGLRRILIRGTDATVCRTVAGEWIDRLSPDARICEVEATPVAGADAAAIYIAPDTYPERMSRVNRPGNGGLELVASDATSLYPLFTRLVEDLLDSPIQALADLTYTPTFSWLRNLNDFFVGSLRTARNFDRESFVRQLARAGFTHVAINGLGTPRPFETSPVGDVYHWFYDYSPDLDQFVDSSLLRGYYPQEYLKANLRALCENAALARKYGLTPGLHINSPRSMPEEFWTRYGYLRGARVDHPRETLRPRYSLALAHPAVQNHYRELMHNVLDAVPDLGIIHVWTNDSGAGFEFVSSLYAGRNGGPYLLREWKDDETIAKAAAANAMTYYKLLAEGGRQKNADFRVVCDLGPFFAERKYIVPELGKGIDAGDFAFFEEQPGGPGREAIEATGALVHLKLDLCDNNVLGVPAPYFVYERLVDAYEGGANAVLTNIAPPSLVPFDINGEVVRLFQHGLQEKFDFTLNRLARAWGGPEYADVLLGIWSLSDAAVRRYPPGIPMSTFGFPWFRLWVRPFVPNIDAIPESERAYYEEFLLATFNNPARVDLNNDMMWNFLSVEQAGAFKRNVDERVLPVLREAIDLCPGDNLVSGLTPRAIIDQRDRLCAAHCYYTTMRNTVAWIESIHGYLHATNEEGRSLYRAMCEDMVACELENAKHLLRLWNTSEVEFIPISTVGDSLHIYGTNFGQLVERKIALMEAHAKDEPYIDPDYMWRMSN
jgi:hypothetical protein